MKCSTILSNLGYECMPLGAKLLRITSPYTYCDDGEQVGVFVQELTNGLFKISDRCDALMNLSSRGIELKRNRLDQIRSLVASQGVQFTERGEISVLTSEAKLASATTEVIRAGLLVSAQSRDWYKEVTGDLFQERVASYLLAHVDRPRLQRKVRITAASGHDIEVPIVLTDKVPKYLFTSTLPASGQWSGAYGLLGKLIDLRQANQELNNRYVVLDDETEGSQYHQLSLLFTDSATVLPFSKRDKWINRVAA